MIGFLVLAVCGSAKPGSASETLSRVRVPAVVGISEGAAVAKLRGARLVPRVTFGRSTKVRRGFVFAQVPVGETYVAKGSAVAIAVSLGKPRVTVPDVVGENVSDAVVRLATVGLRPKIQNVVASTKPADTVLGQTPEPGTIVIKGSVVALAVSSG